ncbi:hypothetical protein [Gottfriedia solisilvae]|uniref:Uncharacterized protein n=1 Tax=Gottfriedia solisilvae TaxID=1516104 RepID=A0A8J3AFH3_9BACI|nr:hypothetical protein [Gottfriedia solisilvae]GGI12929.1 hypothetical protein GCM10007380_15370 [Gottfriedia solisilvae]
MGKIINDPQDGDGITREYYIFIRILSFFTLGKVPKIESKKKKLENRLKELKKKRYRI